MLASTSQHINPLKVTLFIGPRHTLEPIYGSTMDSTCQYIHDSCWLRYPMFKLLTLITDPFFLKHIFATCMPWAFCLFVRFASCKRYVVAGFICCGRFHCLLGMPFLHGQSALSSKLRRTDSFLKFFRSGGKKGCYTFSVQTRSSETRHLKANLSKSNTI